MSERMWEELQETRAERDRLRREVETLRDEMWQRSAWWLEMKFDQRPSVISEAVSIARRLDAILRGER